MVSNYTKKKKENTKEGSTKKTIDVQLSKEFIMHSDIQTILPLKTSHHCHVSQNKQRQRWCDSSPLSKHETL